VGSIDALPPNIVILLVPRLRRIVGGHPARWPLRDGAHEGGMCRRRRRRVAWIHAVRCAAGGSSTTWRMPSAAAAKRKVMVTRYAFVPQPQTLNP